MSILILSPRYRFVQALPIYEALRTPYTLPRPSAWGPGNYFNPYTGRYDGTAVDHTLPTTFNTTHNLTASLGLSAAGNFDWILSRYANWKSSGVGNILFNIEQGLTLSGGSQGQQILSGVFQNRVAMFKIANDSILPPVPDGTSMGSRANWLTDYSLRGILPKLEIAISTQPLVNTVNNGGGMYFRGLEFAGGSVGTQYRFANLYKDDPSKASQKVGFMQCIFTPTQNPANTVCFIETGNCNGVFAYGCMMDQVGAQGTEYRNIWMRGPGPGKFIGIDMMGAGSTQCVMFGGIGLDGGDGRNNPTDYEFGGLTFRHAVGTTGSKADLEVKYGKYILAHENLSANFLSGSPQQCAYVTKVTDQGAGNRYVETTDVTIANNIVDNGYGFWESSGFDVSADGSNLPYVKAQRMAAINNAHLNQTGGDLAVIKMYPFSTRYMMAKWNTLTTRRGGGGADQVFGLYNRDTTSEWNDAYYGQNLVIGNDIQPVRSVSHQDLSPFGDGQTAFANSTALPYYFQDNFVSATNAALNQQLQAANVAAMGLVSIANPRLLPTSAGYRTAPGGLDYGAQWAVLDTIFAGRR